MKSFENQGNIFDIAKDRDIIEIAKELIPAGDFNVYGTRAKSITQAGRNKTCTEFYRDTNSFYDFKTNTGGSVIDLVMHLKNLTALEAAKYLAGDSGYTPEFLSKLQKYQKAIEGKYLAYHENLKNYPDVLKYLHDRRINERKIGVAVDKKTGEIRISIPYFNEQGNIVYGVTRRFSNPESEKYKKEFIPNELKQAGFSQPLLFLDTVRRKDKSVLFIGEGVVDVASVVQESYSGLSFGGGNAGQENIKVYCNYAKQFDKIVLCFDSDEAGENFTFETAQNLLKAGISNFYCIRDYGKDCKDLSDYYTAGGDISALIENAIDGAVFATDKFTSLHPLKGNIAKNTKDLNRKELRKFFAILKKALEDEGDSIGGLFGRNEQCLEIFKNRYSETSLKYITKEKEEREYIEDYTADLIKKYFPKSYGEPEHREYFIYQGDKLGYWRNYNKGDLWKLIINKYGVNNKTAKKIEDEIYPRVKNFDDDTIHFGTSGVLNIQNGVLDLTTNKVLPHDAKYMFDYVLPVKYDEQAKCPKFEKFLDEFSNYNKGRLQTIRDMIGYVLVFEGKEHCIFNLIGTGRNGKGVLFRVFDAVFGKYSTHLKPSEMLSAFRRIELETSLVNTATDVNEKVNNEICEILKSVSGHDMISGNLKYKNAKNFYSHSTLINAFNEIPKYADKSQGFKDRQIYIKCEYRVKGRENLSLDDELKEELSGIFCYFLECARDFVANGCRVRQYEPDAQELSKQVEIENNEVAAFMADFEPELLDCVSPIYTTDKLHSKFVEWLDSTRNRKISMTKQKLTLEIKKLFNLNTRKITAGDDRNKWCFDFTPLIKAIREKEEQEIQNVEQKKSEQQPKEKIMSDKEIEWQKFSDFVLQKDPYYTWIEDRGKEYNYDVSSFMYDYYQQAENEKDESSKEFLLELAGYAKEFLENKKVA